MSKDEIIDKVKSIAGYGDEFQDVYFKIGRLKAVTACTQSYCDNIPDGGTPYIYIMAMLGLIEELAVEIDNELDKGIQLIIDTTSMSA